MEPAFRSRYEQRGAALTLHGDPVKDMDREELIAVIGFLFHQAYGVPDSHEQKQPPIAAEIDLEYPPSNNGLMEG